MFCEAIIRIGETSKEDELEKRIRCALLVVERFSRFENIDLGRIIRLMLSLRPLP